MKCNFVIATINIARPRAARMPLLAPSMSYARLSIQDTIVWRSYTTANRTHPSLSCRFTVACDIAARCGSNTRAVDTLESAKNRCAPVTINSRFPLPFTARRLAYMVRYTSARHAELRKLHPCIEQASERTAADRPQPPHNATRHQALHITRQEERALARRRVLFSHAQSRRYSSSLVFPVVPYVTACLPL